MLLTKGGNRNPGVMEGREGTVHRENGELVVGGLTDLLCSDVRTLVAYGFPGCH